MRLVEEEDGVQFVAVQVMHVRLYGEEEVGGRGRRGEPEGVAEEAIEVASAEAGVAAVGEAKAALQEPVAQGTSDTRLTDTGVAEHQDALSLLERLFDLVDEYGLGLRQPERLVFDLLAEREDAQVEVRENINRSHRRPPRR